ncbi:MAG TPA: AAA family ATPase, partial [Caldilineaceae bacterium]|nr:AAA family ATPase [Caldilineaceae bacterium]
YPQSEGWQRHRLFEAMARAVLARKQPLLLVLDDLQWCDQETLEWLHFLLRYDPQARLLVVGTVRPEEVGPRHPLTALRNGLRTNQQLAEIKLSALTAKDSVQLAQEMCGGELEPELAARLYRDTEGNPLFVVETVRAELSKEIREWGKQEEASPPSVPPGSSTPLPPKVQAVIEARLAQLSPLARKLADLAAAIGRDFTFDALIRASEQNEAEVVDGLDELCQRHIVREQSADRYDFSHDKIREVAYMQISAGRRRLLHRRIAQAVELLYATNLDQASAQLAAHYEKAGLPAQAVPYCRRAAQASLRVSAYREAIEHFHRGLAILADLQDSLDKTRQELACLLELGFALAVFKGFGSSQVHEVYTRAQVLTQQLREPPNPA